ncbi:MAG: hypothetical protein R2800_14690 [Flavipsychrobacter sp.]
MQAIATLLLLCGCATAVLSTTRLQGNRVIAGIDVTVVNNDCRFIDKRTIKEELLADELKIRATKLKELNIHRVENLLVNNPWVASAEVYVDNARDIKVEVVQRVPVVRLFNVEGQSYYLDSTAHEIPLSDNYVHYATTVINVPVFDNDTQALMMNKDIVRLSQYIEQDTFWKAQVSHVTINKEHEFELTPVLGKHKIKLGQVERLEEKFDNLLSFYKKVLNKVGWDKYEVLDVRYKGQLVGSPSVRWNIPEDKVRNSINWISSITGEAPRPIVSAPSVVSATTPKAADVTASKEVAVEDVKVESVNEVAAEGEKNKSVNKTSTTTKVEEEKVKKEKKEPKYIYQGN